MRPAIQSAVVCGHCGARTASDAEAQCSECGAPVSILEPFAVQCGWCAAANRRDQVDVCANCGGPLPSLPGGHPGPRPPPTPRGLPPGYRTRVLYWRNVNVMLGIVCTVLFFWTVVFPAIGIPLWVIGRRRARRTLAALVFGTPTRGRVTAVELDLNQAIRGRHPWLIDYDFDTETGVAHGQCEAWDPSNARRSPGDAIWVVFTPALPGQNALWPPIR
ncbi:MAG: hypothetical protein ACYC8T_19760 [Myxococcaceae bacterium]